MKQLTKLKATIEELRDDPEKAKTLRSKNQTQDGNHLFLSIIDSFRGAAEEITFSMLPEESKNKHVARVDSFLGTFLQFARSSPYDDGMDFDRCLEYLDLLYDNLVLAGSPPVPVESEATRAEIAATTAELIQFVVSAQLTDIIKKAIILKLQGIRRMCEMSLIYDERSIQTQVKLIMADIFSEWERIEKEDSSLARKIREWAARNLRHSGRVLSLTADASAIAGLLSPPR